MEQIDKLMIPGPVEVDAAVLAAMGSPVRPHYGPQWTTFFKETLGLLRQVFNTQGQVFLMPGSGTVAIDACLGSAFQTGEKILVGTNGFFGDRLVWIAEGYGLEVIKVPSKWGEPLTPESFQQALKDNPDVVGAAVVHLETSTTVQNPIEEIGQLLREHHLVFFVDAVSSLGGVPFHMDEWGVDLCAAATQKCLGSPPGLAPVAISERGRDRVERFPHKNHGWYGDLNVWRWYAENWGDWHPTPVTMPTNNVYALRVSLDQLIAEGIENRIARFRKLALRLRDGLRKIGLPPFTPDERMSPVLTAAICPENISSAKYVSHLAENYHIKISGGLGDLREKIIRIGTMSPLVQESDIDNVLTALRSFKP